VSVDDRSVYEERSKAQRGAGRILQDGWRVGLCQKGHIQGDQVDLSRGNMAQKDIKTCEYRDLREAHLKRPKSISRGMNMFKFRK
jgi:hypothetical protein